MYFRSSQSTRQRYQGERLIPKCMVSLAEWPGPCLSRAYVNYTLMPLQAPLSADFLLSSINGAPCLAASEFSLTSTRRWPQPVLLKRIEDGAQQLRVWDPKVRRPISCARLVLTHLAVVSQRPSAPNAHNHTRVSCYVRYLYRDSLNTNSHDGGIEKRRVRNSNYIIEFTHASFRG